MSTQQIDTIKQLTNELNRIASYADTIVRLSERPSEVSEIPLDTEYLDTIFSDIASVCKKSSQQMQELLECYNAQQRKTKYTDPYDLPPSKQTGELKPYVTFHKKWADGTTYDVRISRDLIEQAQKDGKSIACLIDECGDIV